MNTMIKSLLFSAIVLLTVVSVSHAQVLYSDTFSRTTGSGDGNGDPNGAADNFSDWGSNDNGLGGSNLQAWEAGPDRAGGGRNAVTDGSLGINHGTSAFYDFDAAAASPNGFTVALDFARFVTPPANPGGGYIAFGFGVEAGTLSASLNDFTALGASDFAILFQQANLGNTANAQAFQDRGPDGTPAPGSDLGNFDYLDPVGPHTLLLEFTPQVAGAYGDADSIDVRVTVDGSIVQNYVTLGGSNFGALAVSANNFDTRYIDNLVVTAVPEPVMGGFTLLGLSLLLRRRS